MPVWETLVVIVGFAVVVEPLRSFAAYAGYGASATFPKRSPR